MLFVQLIQILTVFLVPVFAVQQPVKLDFDIKKGTNFLEVMKHFFDDALDDVFDLDKRDNGSHTVDLANERAFYVASLQIGTPAREVKVLIDTGSADLWVMSTKNSYCQENGGTMDCTTYGTYNEDNSTTFVKNDTEFSIKYLDNTFAKGTWGQDTVELGDGLKIEGANFAVADETDSYVGVFGIAYKELESTDETYDNLPVQMKQQGLINKNAYSLYLTPAERNTGSILFGAIDHAKYEGELVEFDISLQNGKNVYLQIPLKSITVTLTPAAKASVSAASSDTPTTLETKISSSTPHPTIAAVLAKRVSSIDTNNVNALFDSGTTLTYLEQDIVDQILDQIAPSSLYNSRIGGYEVPCSLRAPGNSLTFNFGDKKDIEAPLSDIIMVAGQSGETGSNTCMLGLVGGDHTILGDNFLRHCYSVFNLDDDTISIAQMKYNDSEEDIEIIQ